MKTCRECNGSMEHTNRPEALFCSSPCRATFNNRRAQRGAELYDLFMALRYDRKLAKAMGIWSIICRLGQLYREDDVKHYKDFVSWLDPKQIVARKPWITARG